MRHAILAATLLVATSAMAQSMIWRGASLVFSGGTVNGCAVQLDQATHSGGPNSQIRLTFSNNGAEQVRVRGEAVLTQGGQRASRQFSVGMMPGVGAWTPGPNPGEVALAGSVLQVSITSCEKR